MKRILPSLLFLCSLLLAGNGASAQTQEKTTAWLKEKLETYFQSKYAEDIKVQLPSPCEITVTFRIMDEGWIYYTMTLPTKGAGVYERNGQGYFFYDNAVVKTASARKGTAHSNDSISSTLFLRNGEENLFKRMNKALEHLATFCAPKKEAF